MKLYFSIIVGLITMASFGQEIGETKVKIDESFVPSYFFEIPICRSQIIIKEWKEFAKGKGGKVGFFGGFIGNSSVKEFRFRSADKELWMAGLKFNNTENDSVIVFNYFYNDSLEYVYSGYDSLAHKKAINALSEFKHRLRLSCVNDEVELAEKYYEKILSNHEKNIKKKMKLEENNQEIESLYPDIATYVKEFSIDKKEKREISKKLKKQESFNQNKEEINQLIAKIKETEEDLPKQQKVIEDLKAEYHTILKEKD